MPIADAYPDLRRDLRFRPAANPAPRTLSPEQLRRFNEDGYISPIDLFTPTEAAHVRAYFDELMAKAEVAGWNSYSINGWHKHCAGIYDLMTQRRILDCLEDLLGPDLVCWGTHFFCKMPEDPKRVSWHQDASYWPLSPAQTVTVWLAIDDADRDNGAMQVVPGSHRHGQINFERSDAAENNVLNQTVNDPQRYGLAPVPLEMRAGQFSLHTDLLLHGSEPNTSKRRRCGLTLRFVPPQVRAHHGWHGNAVLCRGSDPSGHWAHNPRPAGEAVPMRPTS